MDSSETSNASDGHWLVGGVGIEIGPSRVSNLNPLKLLLFHDGRGRGLGIDCKEDRLGNSEDRSTKVNWDRKKLQLGRFTNCTNIDIFWLPRACKTAKNWQQNFMNCTEFDITIFATAERSTQKSFMDVGVSGWWLWVHDRRCCTR